MSWDEQAFHHHRVIGRIGNQPGTWLAMAPLLRGVVFAVNVLDPIIYARTAVLLVAGVAVSAMLRPARLATNVDPMMVLATSN